MTATALEITEYRPDYSGDMPQNSARLQCVKGRAVTADMGERFLAYIDVRKDSADTYRKSIRRFLSWLNDNGITAPQRQDVIAWRDDLKATHKATTVQNYLTAVKLFFSWLAQENLYPNVADHVKGVKIDKGFKHDYLTSRQCADVLEAIDQRTETGRRDYAMMVLMLTTGLRTVEVSRANVEDLRPSGDIMVLHVQGKGKDDAGNFVPVPERTEKILRAYLAGRNAKDGEPLFTSTSNRDFGSPMHPRSISRIAKEAFKAAGYDSRTLTAHSCRHTAATLNLLNGGTVQETQQLLRHASINTTMIYSHNLEKAQNKSAQRAENAIFCR